MPERWHYSVNPEDAFTLIRFCVECTSPYYHENGQWLLYPEWTGCPSCRPAEKGPTVTLTCDTSDLRQGMKLADLQLENMELRDKLATAQRELSLTHRKLEDTEHHSMVERDRLTREVARLTLRYTSEPPKVPGDYLRKKEGYSMPQIERVSQWQIGRDWHHSQWCGPLTIAEPETGGAT